jgi:Fe-S cluster biosynthesis and repair protein YggX
MMTTKIRIEGDALASAYAVYIIELSHNGKQYFYIGQTGDSHYITARPCFRRLVGHLENKNRSTQNQIYKFVAYEMLGFEKRDKKIDFTLHEKEAIENWLTHSTIEMTEYKLEFFDFHASKELHTEKRRAVLEFEKKVIQLFSKVGKTLINKSQPAPKSDIIAYTEAYADICKTFEI